MKAYENLKPQSKRFFMGDLLANAYQVARTTREYEGSKIGLSIPKGKEISNDRSHELRVPLRRVSKSRSPRFIELKRRRLRGDRYFNEWLDGK